MGIFFAIITALLLALSQVILKRSFRQWSPAIFWPLFFALYRPWVELAELLAEITPGNLKKSLFFAKFEHEN